MHIRGVSGPLLQIGFPRHWQFQNLHMMTNSGIWSFLAQISGRQKRPWVRWSLVFTKVSLWVLSLCWCTHLHAVCWVCDLAGRPGVSGGCRAGGPLYVDSATPATHLLKMPHRRAACSYQRGDTHAAAGQHADTRRQELSTLEFN